MSFRIYIFGVEERKNKYIRRDLVKTNKQKKKHQETNLYSWIWITAIGMISEDGLFIYLFFKKNAVCLCVCTF